MAPELEKPRVTELQVRMDCHGCVQKIKKAMHGVDGVYDIYIDFAQQKLTVIGRAELEKIIKAIKKTKKIATICSHTDPNSPEPPPPAEPAANGQSPPAPEASNNPPPSEAPPAKPEEQPKEPPAPPQENQAPENKASPEAKEIHMVHYYPYSYICSSQQEVPRYAYQWTPAPKSRFNWAEAYDDDYYQSRRVGDGNKITSMFSEENPNNCTIV